MSYDDAIIEELAQALWKETTTSVTMDADVPWETISDVCRDSMRRQARKLLESPVADIIVRAKGGL
jgi:hypothetical protein